MSQQCKYCFSNWEVIGLLFGARGMITKFTTDTFHHFSLPSTILTDAELQILHNSLTILHNHLFINFVILHFM